MINIRPISDLRNKFSEIESIVLSKRQPVFLTKNGYGSMVVMSIEEYSRLTNDIETKLMQADKAAEETAVRYSAEEVFSRLRANIDG